MHTLISHDDLLDLYLNPVLFLLLCIVQTRPNTAQLKTNKVTNPGATDLYSDVH